MQRGTWVILEGSGGELAREFVPFPGGIEEVDDDYQRELQGALAEVTSCGINAGDIIRFVEGESERD